MKRYMPWMVMPFLALVGCDSDSGNPSDTTDATDTRDTSDTADTTPGVSALTGVNTNVTVTTPTPNAACDASKVDNGTYGATYPWGGLNAAGTDFTCNKYPGGIQAFQGEYRWYGYEADLTTPDYAQGSDADTGNAEILFIDGNTWYSKLYVKSRNVTEEKRGWFFGTQKPEHPNEHLFWVITEVVDDGGSGLVPGDVLRSNVILWQGSSPMIEWFDDLTGPRVAQFAYCKLGTTSGGKPCNNPFE